MNARDRSQIPGHAERARIVALISVQLAAAVLIIGRYTMYGQRANCC